MFELIRTHIGSGGDAAWYDELYDAVQADTLMLLRRRRLPPELQEELAQTVQIKVFRGLVRFYQSPWSQSEGQRSAWLRTVVENVCRDHFRAVGRSGETQTSLEELEETAPLAAQERSDSSALERRETMLESLGAVFAYPTSAEKILGFCFLKLSAVSGGGTNGKAQAVDRHLAGRRLDGAFAELRALLENLLGYELPPQVTEPFAEKLRRTPDAVYGLSVGKLTKSASRMTGDLKRSRGKDDNENDDDGRTRDV